MKTTLVAALLVAPVLAVSGCGGSNHASATTTAPPTTRADASSETSAAKLSASARKALRQNYGLSLYVLWHNKLPARARQSTRGPALAGLRTSAEGRKKRGIHVRVLDRRFRIVALTLDPSYTRATATIQSRQHVRPYRGSKPLGRPVKLNERARVELHRLDKTPRFVVWKVQLLK